MPASPTRAASESSVAAERRSIEVWAEWEGLPTAQKMGLLHATPSRGKEVFSFEYDEAWLASPHALALDPSLQLSRGPQYAPAELDNFGVFLDSSPDRWGRTLMIRREAQQAREEGRAARNLLELDYLLGVYDGHRMGALRYRFPGGPYLDDNTQLASPPWTSLRELEQASLALERPGAEKNPAYGKWLRMLMAPGRSLGGARPKASVLDEKGHLWIAKFPSKNDLHDVGAWESVLHALARKAGVVAAESKVKIFGAKHHTFLSRRFDRTDSGARLHFASAMTLLQHRDGDPASYLELAQFLVSQGARAQQDLEQLWRRIAFSVCVSNVDDHLRNHGFLLRPKSGWTLAPAYDLNPVATGDGLALNISESDNAQDLELVRDVAANFRLSLSRATEILAEVTTATKQWRAEAKKHKLPRDEQERMADAFRIGDAA